MNLKSGARAISWRDASSRVGHTRATAPRDYVEVKTGRDDKRWTCASELLMSDDAAVRISGPGLHAFYS